MKIESVNSCFKKAETDANAQQNTVKNEDGVLFESANEDKKPTDFDLEDVENELNNLINKEIPDYLDVTKIPLNTAKDNKANGEKAANYAHKFIGMNEEEIEEATGRRFDDDLWSTEFVQMVLEDTYGNNLPGWYKQCQNKGYSEEVLYSARKNDKVTTNPDEIQSGDLAVFLDDNGKSYHTAIVDSIEDDTLYTIEGNYYGGICSSAEHDKNEANMVYIKMTD